MWYPTDTALAPRHNLRSGAPTTGPPVWRPPRAADECCRRRCWCRRAARPRGSASPVRAAGSMTCSAPHRANLSTLTERGRISILPTAVTGSHIIEPTGPRMGPHALADVRPFGEDRSQGEGAERFHWASIILFVAVRRRPFEVGVVFCRPPCDP